MFGSHTRLGPWLFVVRVLGSVEAWWFWRPKPWKNDVLNATPATILLWSLRQFNVFNVWLEFTNCCCEAFWYLFYPLQCRKYQKLGERAGKNLWIQASWRVLKSNSYSFRISSTLDSLDHIWLAESQVVPKRQSQKPRSWVFTCQHQILSSQRTWSRKKWRNPIQRYLNVYREVRWQAISFIVKMISFWA